MRTILQRVTEASVEIENEIVGSIANGLLILLGITQEDGTGDIDWLVKKITQLRIFNDAEGKMNLSISDAGGSILLVSQFTLYADSKKGNRPSYFRSAHPDLAIPKYEEFLQKLRENFSGKIATGRFGAMMKVNLVNDGPVTIILDSKNPSF